jgi:hypothetical protein
MVAGCKQTLLGYRGDEVVLTLIHPQQVLPELEGLRAYTNQAFKDLAVRNHMAVPQVADDWQWIPIRALYRKKKADEPPPLVEEPVEPVA